ncbi:MAG: hypothetical protein WC405_17815 [Syntrophales bacterium]
MPYIISVTSGKEKIVKAILAKRRPQPSLRDLLRMDLTEHDQHTQGVDCSIPPSFSGFLVCETILPPQGIQNIPYILGVTEATSEQVKGLMTGVVKHIIADGMMVQMVRGEYSGFIGIVRTMIGNDTLVDLSIYGRMVAVRVPVDDVKGISHED